VPARPVTQDPRRLRPGLIEQDIDALYRRLSRLGMQYGPAFRSLRQLYRRDNEAVGLVEIPKAPGENAYVLHPVVLDACLHAAAAFFSDDTLRLPAGLDRITVYDRLPERVWCQVRWHGVRDSGDATMELTVLSETGERLVTVDRLRLSPLSRRARAELGGTRPHRYEVVWQPVPGEPAPARSDGVPLIIHGGPYEASGDPERTYQLLQRCVGELQEYVNDHSADHTEFVVYTTGAADLPGQRRPVDPAQAALAGLAKAVIAEYPDVKCVHVDLDPTTAAPPPEVVLDHVAALPGAGHLAVRGDTWYEARLREYEPESRPAPRVRPDATYLVTGGLGGMGRAITAWLAERGAGTVVLAGRTVPATEPAAVTKWRAHGVRVEVRSVDVADPAAVAELFAYMRRDLPPLRGIVHAAGVTADGALADLDWRQFRDVLDPKVRGGWNLLAESADDDLDFVVLCSSMASLVGSVGQANYVAANAFLDALAQHGRREGRPTTSVSWGPWAEVGMASRTGALDHLAARGLDALAPAEAVRLLAGVVASSEPHLGLARVDWNRVRDAVSRRQSYTLLADLLPAGPLEAPAGPDLDALTALALREPMAAREAVLTALLAQVAAILQLGPAAREALRPAFAQTRLNQAGLDSLTTVQLRDRLRADFAADIPPDLLLGGGTAAAVADLICQQLAVRSVIAADSAQVDETAEVFTL
jgi:NAD(P)-dependent dehydrogenase (short-subunit alcohol dehydrogenase family)